MRSPESEAHGAQGWPELPCVPTHVSFAKDIYLLQENRAQERNRNRQNSKHRDKNVISEFAFQKYMVRAFQIAYICGRRFCDHWFAGLT